MSKAKVSLARIEASILQQTQTSNLNGFINRGIAIQAKKVAEYHHRNASAPSADPASIKAYDETYPALSVNEDGQ